MSLIQDIPAERLARLFHHYQEILTHRLREPEDNIFASDESSTAWERTPEADRKLLIAAAQLSLMELDSEIDRNPQSYYAKPGEAEWGC